jgi:hypothetical protein
VVCCGLLSQPILWWLYSLLTSKITSLGSDTSSGPRLCWWHQHIHMVMHPAGQEQDNRTSNELVDRLPKPAPSGVRVAREHQQAQQQEFALSSTNSAKAADPLLGGSAPGCGGHVTTSADRPVGTELVGTEANDSPVQDSAAVNLRGASWRASNLLAELMVDELAQWGDSHAAPSRHEHDQTPCAIAY